MPYELFLALRYLRARPSRRLARASALAAITGISFGVAALIVALALSNGFRDEMRDKILRGTAHITLMRADGQPMADYRSVAGRVRTLDGVSEAAATTYDGALLSGTAGSAYAVLRGVDRESARAVAEIRHTLVEGSVESLLNDAQPDVTREGTTQERTRSEQNAKKDVESKKKDQSARPTITSFGQAPSEAALPCVVIGAELSARTGLHAGDVAQLISGEATLTPLGLAPRYRRVRIAGVFRSGLYEYDATWVYVSLATAASFAGQSGTYASAISLQVTDIYDAARVATRVRAALGEEYTTVDWQEANRPLFAALVLERRMGLFIIALIIIVAALNITTTLVLVVVERRADIAILSAMGARARSIMCLFLLEGAFIGGIGACGGVLLGLAACFIGDHYRLVSLPADVYSISNVPFHAHARDVALAALVAFILSLLATIYPARAAARVRPAEALRDQ